MARPAPAPIPPAELVARATATMKGAKFPMLASIDGVHPRVRPVSPVRTDGFVVYVANLRMYHKTAELAANPQVELCYLDEQHNQVRIAGMADVLTDHALLQTIWDANPLLRQYLGTIDNPALIVYRIVPQRVRYMQEWALDYYDVPTDGKG